MANTKNGDTLHEVAWPIDPMYDVKLVERGDAVTVTIFNDSNAALTILNGKISPLALWITVDPILRLIERQSDIIASLGPTVRLYLRWIPGHGHKILPHQRADKLSRISRERQRSYWYEYDNN
ncbi:uncharacterized protein C8A04DRAFT_30933 [Dichotomopilus funicola]|uniref:Uncharacterized protein n=1 Tax=Dichotomopilus funicola TaxID=1934379 RepID=A0AAN6UZP5_9PEZI|nr:hypothetical protein C8A04DRAFT_30933 [Dichotomopilus funicola]